MEAKHTQALAVFVDNHLATGELVIHPNDGFDLGLMNDRHAVSVSFPAGGETSAETIVIPGTIRLSNSCRSGTLLVSK
ncbi:MAG TPA: hypothetical protein ENN69_04745, partial [Spirochaetia bacterium]|nr:hypothetical protein [Spirochaetia bacterium]